MRVSNEADHTTNAVIGYEKVEEMGIDSSPEFFNILSSSIYKHQMFAVVREVISNAWDAHIESGKTDTPISITVNDSEFVVTDKGTGIAPALIQPVYGIYGKGTKRDKTNSIGGFGLGCKSPFAYTDNFEVTSCYEGTKTIYRVTKGSKIAGGKPAIITLLSVPCGEETGITVSIPLKKDDSRRFETLAKEFIKLGDINAEVNDELVSTIGMGFNKGDYKILPSNLVSMNLPNLDTHVAIRYANVLYPLPQGDIEIYPEYTKKVEKLKTFIQEVNDNTPYTINLVIQADNNSLSVQPSREALSETEFTIASLSLLIDEFMVKVNTLLTTTTNSNLDKFIKTLDDSDFTSCGELYQNHFPSTGRVAFEHKDVQSLSHFITKFKETRPLSDNERNQIMLHSLSLLPKKIGTPKEWVYIISKHLRALSTDTYLRRSGDYSTNYQFRADYPVSFLLAGWYKKIITKNSSARLYCWFNSGVENGYKETPLKLGNTFNVALLHPYYLHQLGNRQVVLTSNLRQLTERINHYNRQKENTAIKATLVVHVRAGKKNVEEARELLENSGYPYVDFTQVHPWEKETNVSVPKRKSTSRIDRNIKKDSIPALSSIFTDKGKIHTPLSCLPTAKRVEKPISNLLIYINNNTPTDSLTGYYSSYLVALNKYYGDQIGIVSSVAQKKKWDKVGNENITKLMVDKCLELWKQHKKELINYQGTKIPNSNHTISDLIGMRYNYHHSDLLSTIRVTHPKLLPWKQQELSKDAQDFIELLNIVTHQINEQSFSDRKYLAPLEAIKNELDAVPLVKPLIKFLKQISSYPYLDYVNINNLEEDANGILAALESKPHEITETAKAFEVYLTNLVKQIRKTPIDKD